MKTKGSLLVKTAGVLIFLLLVFAYPVIGHAEDSDVIEFLGRIPASDSGTPLDPDLPTDFEPGTFQINVMAYEQRVVADEKFACIVSYAYSANSTEPAENATVNLVLSKDIKTLSFYDHHMEQLDYDVVTLENGDTSVTFHLDASLPSGTLGNIIAVAKLDSEIYTTEEQPFCSATISADNVESVGGNTMEINPLLHAVDWMLMAYQQAPEAVPAPGSDVTYGVTLYGNSEECDVEFVNLTITAEYPENAEVTDSNGGEVDEAARTVTWQADRLMVDDMIEQTITIHYPDTLFTDDISAGDKMSIGGIVVTVTAGIPGSSDTYVLQRAYSHEFSEMFVALGSPGNGTSFEEEEYCGNEVAVYTINGIENKGNIAFDTLYMTATMPAGLKAAYVKTGKFNSDVNVLVQYKTATLTVWQNWATPSAMESETLDVSALGLSEPITQIKWTLTAGNEKMNPGFTARDTVQILPTVTADYGDYVDLSVNLLASATTDSDTASANIIDTDRIRVMPIWPDGLSDKRKQIIETAFTLIGEVEYYLGGKSTVIGIDPAWGTYQYNSNSVKYENYGLDCSGYVVWTLINAGFSVSSVVNDLGLGTYYQWPNCYEVSPEEMLPGDLAFKQPPTAAGYNHVGFIVGRDSSGMLLVAHCSSTYNTVVVTPYAGTFYYMRRPYIY